MSQSRPELVRIDTIEHESDPGYAWAECLCAEIDPEDTPCVVCDARYEFRTMPQSSKCTR